MAPTNSLMASGRSVFLMKLELADGGGPGLPADIARADHLAGVEIGFGDQHVDGRERRRRRLLGRFRRAAAARQHGGDAAGGESDTQYDEARGFHYA